jgi:hypothetical protein
MAPRYHGLWDWSLERDECGDRDYSVTHLVECSTDDGPANVIQCPGLPLPGSLWAFKADSDVFAWCRYTSSVRRHQGAAGEPGEWYEVEQKFSTRPLDYRSCACKTNDFQDPLLEPPKITGIDRTFTEEATRDRYGMALLTSSHEQIRGPQVEFDAGRSGVRIEQNVASLSLAATLPGLMRDHVNDRPLWGFARRMVKLSGHTWARQFYNNCLCYFTRVLEFEFNPDTWDRKILDEGTKALKGHWDKNTGAYVLEDIAPGVFPDPTNPSHFCRVKDRRDDNTRMVLDGNGLPAGVTVIATQNQAKGAGVVTGTGTGTLSEETGVGTVLIEKYSEVNFLELAVPLTFDC